MNISEDDIQNEFSKLKDDDDVISCKYIEGGVRFTVSGIKCCCANTWESPVIITNKEINDNFCSPVDGKDNFYDLMILRRKRLFLGLNNKLNVDIGDCSHCDLRYKTKFKDISFDYLGAPGMLSSGFNISHFSYCNLRCKYCVYTQQNSFVKPQYHEIINFVNEFKKRNKIRPGIWIEYNGGEPTLLPNFGEILNFLVKNSVGDVCVFSNGVKYNQDLADCLSNDKCYLTTSIDAGTPETYQKIHGRDYFNKVIENCIKYRNTGTHRLFLKYIITEDNKNDRDLLMFVLLMSVIRPDQIYICPEFPYGDAEIPDDSSDFAAKMWYMLRTYLGKDPYIQTDDMKANPKFKVFSDLVRDKFKKLYQNLVNCSSLLPNGYELRIANNCNLQKITNLTEANSKLSSDNSKLRVLLSELLDPYVVYPNNKLLQLIFSKIKSKKTGIREINILGIIHFKYGKNKK